MQQTTAVVLLGSLTFLSSRVAAQTTGPVPTFPYDCSDRTNFQEIQRSPPGAGVASIAYQRATGNVPHIRVATNRGTTAGDWYDDKLGWEEYWHDNESGTYTFRTPSRFAAMPNDGTFLVRLYGQWSENGTWKDFRVTKQCTTDQTQISYFNAFDAYPNLVVTITWTKPYAGL
jgi:hypothetical protein